MEHEASLHDLKKKEAVLSFLTDFSSLFKHILSIFLSIAITMVEPGLTNEQLSSWHQNGYLIIPHELTPAEVSALIEETHSLLENMSLEDHPKTIFSTGGKVAQHVKDE